MFEKIKQIKEVPVHLSQKNLAAKLKKNEHNVSNWCINKSQPHLKELLKIAELLEVDIRNILPIPDSNLLANRYLYTNQ